MYACASPKTPIQAGGYGELIHTYTKINLSSSCLITQICLCMKGLNIKTKGQKRDPEVLMIKNDNSQHNSNESF